MLEIKIEKAFKKDIARDKKSGLYSVEDFELLKIMITDLQNEREIDEKFKRHLLKGNMKAFESLHLKGDWLLIFKVDKKYLNLLMLGKHTQVYKKFK
ncbi:MAG TPA: type II toxin-antitoxin system YafQ family toxin [Campylobacterales bacterium]|nr:type II toxin-antitoxin system YafQ family toxin [Campylobacterales bacterium]